VSDSRASIDDAIFEYVQRCAKHRTEPERDEHGPCPYGAHAKALAIVAERPWKIPGDSLTASEAVYGFMAFLTTLPGSHVFGATHDTGGYAARLVGQFCQSNTLTPPSDDYHTRLNFPKTEEPK